MLKTRIGRDPRCHDRYLVQMKANDDADPAGSRVLRERLRVYFGLEPNIVAASLAVFLLGMGEELWKKFLPKYLEALGAGVFAIGFFGTVQDFLDAVYQYPGGWIADRFGRRTAFIFFILLACLGYSIYLLSPSWIFVFLGLVFAMAWSSMASPAIFAVIGDSLPKERRAIGFTVQSILKRVPAVIAPIIGGIMVVGVGIIGGVRTGLIVTLALALISIFIVSRINIPVTAGEAVNLRGVWQSFHGALKRLLVSDIIIRMCENLSEKRSFSANRAAEPQIRNPKSQIRN